MPDDPVKMPIWDDYDALIWASGESFKGFASVERFAFYERSQQAYAVVATSETALYANVILKKGIVA